METEVKQNTEVITYENAFIALKKYFLDKNESNVQDLIELIQVGFDSTKEKEGANGAFVGGSNTPNFDFINNYHEIPSGFRDQKEVMIDAVKSLNGMMRWHHPSTLQNITPTPSLVSLAISTLVSAYNPNLIWDYVSGGIQSIERQIVMQFSEYFNWKKDISAGTFTFGGKACHTYAIRAGLNRAIKNYPQKGLQGNQVALITTKFNHYILESAASMLGLGKDSCIRLNTHNDETIDLVEFEVKLRELFSKKIKVPCIILSGGSTINLNIDPVIKVKEIAEKVSKDFNLDYVPFIYFDTVVGFPWIFYKNYNFSINKLNIEDNIKGRIQVALTKILEAEFADGVGIDFHKSGFCAYSNSLFLMKDGPELHSISTENQNFLEEKEYGSNFTQVYTIEHSRSGNPILAAWCTLQSIGEIGFQAFIAYTMKCGDIFREILPKYGFELINPISLTYSPVFFASHLDSGIKSYKQLVDEQDPSNIIENTNYLYQLTQYISKDTPEGAAIDVGFIKQYLESSCKTRHAALRIFPMAIDKTTADCSKIAHIIGNKKIKFDLNYKSTFANLSPEVIHR